ncbi:hypothetical protein MHYP_G00353950 [Metynnis hypsauchen]
MTPGGTGLGCGTPTEGNLDQEQGSRLLELLPIGPDPPYTQGKGHPLTPGRAYKPAPCLAMPFSQQHETVPVMQSQHRGHQAPSHR